MSEDAQYLARWELDGVGGTVVVVDVIRAFSTVAYAFDAGATEIWLADSVEDALALGATHPGSVVMGEDGGFRPDGFDLPNSPVLASLADLAGRTVVQRTSAGTRGAVAAVDADRIFVTGLVTATATARAVAAAGPGAPAYVITGRLPERPDRLGPDDLLTARYVEDVRLGRPVDPTAVAASVASTDEATRTLALGEGHVHPDDISFATDVDRFDFAMEAERVDGHLRVRRIVPS